MKSYSGCGFMLILPDVYVSDNRVVLTTQVKIKPGSKTQIVFQHGIFKNIFGEEFASKNLPSFIHKSGNLSVEVTTPKKVNILKKTSWKLTFLSSTGEKIVVVFFFPANGKASLEDVIRSEMTDLETNIYALAKLHAEKVSLQEPKTEQPIQKKDQGTGNSIATSFNKYPSLEKYRTALKTERSFLQHEGGKKHRVTNGKLVSKLRGTYTYVFDLETELHISDDAPISVTSSGLKSQGNVLMCEDFQIMVQLEYNIGDTIGSAYISVEPWKLLTALEDRLSERLGASSGIANALINKGPKEATKESITKIPRGQKLAMDQAKKSPITVIWGPPGTGKTYTMSKLALDYLDQGKTILIVSHSNVSVDGVAGKINELLNAAGKSSILKSGKVLRYGYIRNENLKNNEYVNSFLFTAKKSDALSKKLDALQEEYAKEKHIHGMASGKIIEIQKEISKIKSQIKSQEQYYVSKARIVITTISKVTIDKVFDSTNYDVVMFDEVSMAYVLQIICAATYAKERFICVGDFMQLAPIAQSSAKDILCEDIFTYLKINVGSKPYYHPWLVMLDEQRRMYPDISAFSNMYIYHNMLKDHESVKHKYDGVITSEMFPDHSINLIDLAGSYCAAGKDSGNSRFNILSGFLSFSCALKTRSNVETISIITPYAAQTRLIRALVLDTATPKSPVDIRCATVHQFQGSESDAIVFDAVESYPAKKPGWLMGKDFDSIRRLINVAVTRARGKLIVVANNTFWLNNYKGSKHTLYRLLQYLTEKGSVIKHPHDKSLEHMIEGLNSRRGPQYYLDESYIGTICEDIAAAREKIVISLPTGFTKNHENIGILNHVVNAKERGVQILLKSNAYKELPDDWKKITWGTNNATFPLIVIDDRITWYGAPRAKWKFEVGTSGYMTVCPVTVRMAGAHTAEIIRSLTNLEYRETDSGVTPLLMKDTVGLHYDQNDSDGMQQSGLAAYVAKKKICPACKNSFKLTKGKSGKTILWCENCKKTELLTPEEVNHYIYINNVVCPQHKCDIKAKLGPFGVYIQCDYGHNLKPEQI